MRKQRWGFKRSEQCIEIILDECNHNKDSKTSFATKDFASLYSSIANDFRRKKSLSKPASDGPGNDTSSNDGAVIDANTSKSNYENESKDESPTLDPESLFAQAIVDGDLDGIQGYLESVESAKNIATMQLNTQCLKYSSKGNVTYDFC